MPRGFDHPTSSSLSRTINAGAREPLRQPSAQTRPAQYETPVLNQNSSESTQPQTLETRRKSTHSALLLPQLLNEPQLDPPARKSPSYLQGKNPYGQVLDHVEHPYREPKGATAGPPSQAGGTVGSRPRTSASFEFRTRVPPSESERTSSTPIAEQDPARLRQLPKPVSVDAARQLFEIRATQNRPGPLLPPARSAVVSRVPTKAKAQAVHHLPPASKAEVPSLSVVVKKATEKNDALVPEDIPVTYEISSKEHDSTARRMSTDIFDNKSRDTMFPGDQRQVDNSTFGTHEPRHASLAVLGKIRPTNDRHRDKAYVSSMSSLISGPVAETEEDVTSAHRTWETEDRCSQFSRDVRRAIDQDKSSSPKGIRSSRSQDSSLTGLAPSYSPTNQATNPKVTSSSTTPGNSVLQRSAFGPTVVRRRMDHLATGGLNHDGSIPGPPASSRHKTMFQPPAAVSDVKADPDDIEVPDHVDWRSAYGRRKTRDFGFAGVHRANKPLKGTGVWIKRSCGHFTPLGKSETPEQPSWRLCRQCSATRPLPGSGPSSHQHVPKRAVTQPSIAPELAQTLNVKVPGQVNPNVNDTRSTLQETVRTMPDLIHLVNSAADDFGVDLDKRPSARDDRKFHNTPCEDDRPPSASSRRKGTLTKLRKSKGKRRRIGNAPWVQQSHSLLADLSETHVQLLSQLDSLAEDFGEQNHERDGLKPMGESLQRVLNRMSEEAHIRSSRADISEIPVVDHQINQAHLDKVLTRITAHSDRVTAITRKLQSIVEFAPEAIQIIVKAPQADRQVHIVNELDPYAIHPPGAYKKRQHRESVNEPAGESTQSPNNVDQDEFDTGSEDAVGARYKQEMGPYLKSRQQQVRSSNPRIYTEVSRMSQNRISGHGHRIQERYRRSSSLPHPTKHPTSVSQHRSISSNESFASPEPWLAEEEVDQPYLERIGTGRTSKPHYMRFPASHEVGTDESFSSDL
jgi:hypothetical protein